MVYRSENSMVDLSMLNNQMLFLLLPIKLGGSFHGYVSHNQMVFPVFSCEHVMLSWRKKTKPIASANSTPGVSASAQAVVRHGRQTWTSV